MSFPAQVAKRVRKRAHFQCCLCKSVGVDIHHIVPKSQGGTDDIENAAPLCPSCHEIYGDNPSKRKMVREARDAWYEICDSRYQLDDAILAAVRTELRHFRDEARAHNASSSAPADRIAPNDRSLNIRIPSGRSARKSGQLTLSEALAIKFAKKSKRRKNQYGILALEGMWPEEDGYRDIYRSFVSTFGSHTLDVFAAQALDQMSAKAGPGLHESDIATALKHLAVECALFLMLEEGKLTVQLGVDDPNNWEFQLARKNET